MTSEKNIAGETQAKSLESRYWFPAKRYGWGWGFPTRWQGWIASLAYVALLFVDSIVFPPAAQSTEFFFGLGFLSVAMLLTCYWRGEPPAWRWGRLP